ncbi:MAG: PAS domain S-box protein [Chloroflexi bacterium]|nr:PAS domain S-box protein [Chloroflexota bacterium]
MEQSDHLIPPQSGERINPATPAPSFEFSLERVWETSPRLNALLDSQGVFRRVNSSVAKTMGYAKEELLGRSYFDFLHPDDSASVLFEAAAAEGLPLEFRTRLRTGAEGYIWAEWFARYLSRDLIYLSGRDISERVRLREDLIYERDKLTALLEGLDRLKIAINTTDADYIVRFENPTVREMYGSALGKHCYEVYAGRKAPCDPCLMMEALRTGEVQQADFLASNGRTFATLVAPYSGVHGHLDHAFHVNIDITERKKAEEASRGARHDLEDQVAARTAELRRTATVLRREGVRRSRAEAELRALARRLVQLQEEERRAIARELHDGIGQELHVLMLLSERCANAPEEVRAAINREARNLITGAIDRVSGLSLDLRPKMLDDVGLLPTLAWEFERCTQRTGVRVIFEHSGADKECSADICTNVYRIVQEALMNVVRHAHTSEATVRLCAVDDMLRLTIEDHGIGFIKKRLPTSAGLSGMRERALSLGGKMTVRSRPGAGTVVEAEIPLLSFTAETQRAQRGDDFKHG